VEQIAEHPDAGYDGRAVTFLDELACYARALKAERDRERSSARSR
jgi:hypothetical protein